MCYGCYEEAGKPAIVNHKTRQVAKAVSKIYEYNGVGSNAHIVVDDWNLDDESIDWSLTEGLSSNVHESTAEQLDIERQCLTLLKSLTEDERYSALAIQRGFVTP